MNCAEIEIAICDYQDGTLPADRKAEVERHLANARPAPNWGGCCESRSWRYELRRD